MVQNSYDVGETRIIQSDFVDRNPGFDILVHGLQPLEMLAGILPGESQRLREHQDLVCSRNDLVGKYRFRIVHRYFLKQRSACGAFPIAVNYQKCERSSWGCVFCNLYLDVNLGVDDKFSRCLKGTRHVQKRECEA